MSIPIFSKEHVHKMRNRLKEDSRRIGSFFSRTARKESIKSMRRDDQEFLPAALEVLERPPSPVGKNMVYFIVFVVVVAGLWSWMGWTDIVAVGSGKVQPAGRVKTVQVFEISKLSKLTVSNGQRVKAGDVVAEFEPEEALADQSATSAAVLSGRAEIIRRHHSAAILGQPKLQLRQITWPADIPQEFVRSQEKIFLEEFGAVLAQLQTIEAQKIQKQAELDKLSSMLGSQQTLLDVLQERLKIRQSLLEQNDVSKVQVLESQEALTQQRTIYLNQQGSFIEAQRAIAVLDSELRKIRTGFLSENAAKLSDAERFVQEYKARDTKAVVRVERTVLRSPVDGVVIGSTLTSIGQVFTPGQEVMRVVPESSEFEIEVYLPNKDIGFIELGQEAAIKIESFPFTRYGTLSAKVTHVGRDAIPEADAKQLEADGARSPSRMEIAGAQRVQSLVFPVTLVTTANQMNINGRSVDLLPGMAVTAEVKIGRRRVLEYLFAPLIEVTNRAMREK